jgi:hypothetical protein
MNREKERNQKRADLKREGRTETLLAFFFFFAGDVIPYWRRRREEETE